MINLDQTAGADHLDAGYQGGFGNVLRGDDHGVDVGLGRDGDRGQHPGHRAQPPVQAELGEEHLPGQHGNRHRVGGGEDRNGDRQVEPAAPLGQGGG